MDLIAALDQTFQHTHGIIANVSVDQYNDSTPCADWAVRDLLEHTIGVVAGLGATARGEVGAPFELGADPATQFKDAATSTLAAWRSPGVLDRVIDGGAGQMPGHVLAGINLLDTATHAWDIAAATGQPSELPDAVATTALEVSRATISPEMRPGRFGPEVPAAANASPTELLVAFLGRTS